MTLTLSIAIAMAVWTSPVLHCATSAIRCPTDRQTLPRTSP
jgi:hypothetical protein